MSPRQVLADVRDNWQSLALALVVVLVIGYGDIRAYLGVSHDLHTFKGAVCKALADGRKADTAQATYYDGLADRATKRAEHEHGGLKAADKDAATTAARFAEQYRKAAAYHFPGCE